MTDPIYFDTETCGLHGPIVLIQWAEGDGPITLHSVWTSPIHETVSLIEKIASHPGGVVGFNLAFDWFHLCQLYTTLCLLPDWNAYPEDLVEEYALLESKARDGLCLKPVKALDLMLHARKGPYQSTMERKDIRIRRVPTALAWQLAQELERRIPLSDIYFARKKDKHAPRWKIDDITDQLGEVDPDFKELVLSFAPSSALKVLAIDALKLPPDSTLLFANVNVDDAFLPEELGYAPFATAIGSPGAWNGAWPSVIEHHIRHWKYYELAREYAMKDVLYLQMLHKAFDYPELGDNDSELACAVGAVRWRGYRVDLDGIRRLKAEAQVMAGKYPTAPEKAKQYIQECMDATERLGMKGTTARPMLETVARLEPQICVVCNGTCNVSYRPNDEDGERTVPCDHCEGQGRLPHPAAERATQVLKARQAEYEIDFYNKLLRAGRLHASFVVVGTLSSRMAGTDGLNTQGIKNDPTVRSEFPLAWPGTDLSGGDFSGFEVVLAEACYNDPDLRRDLTTKRPCHKCIKRHDKDCTSCDRGIINRGTPEETWCRACNEWKPKEGCDDCYGSGITDTKIHALFGQFVYPNLTYEQILADKLIYTRCKSAVFAMLYGGEAFTLKTRLGVEIEIAEKAYEEFGRRYPGVARNRQLIINMFQSMRQLDNKEVVWHEPCDYIESMFGFRRYFTLENRITRSLFELAKSVPAGWKAVKVKVQRDLKNRGRVQTATGAVQSALYGAAFALQAANTRAAANHVIQSSGATITKHVQRRIWDIQPTGVSAWRVQPMNIHDEIMCPTDPAYTGQVAEAVATTVESYRAKVPLIKIEWEPAMASWAEK